MLLDQKKPKTQRPTNGNGSASLELEDLQASVPEVDDLVDEIDKLLAKTAPQERCWC